MVAVFQVLKRLSNNPFSVSHSNNYKKKSEISIKMVNKNMPSIWKRQRNYEKCRKTTESCLNFVKMQYTPSSAKCNKFIW
jgi:hypothetical protein